MVDQNFVHLLESLLSPDTERIKNATAKLKKDYYNSPDSVVALLHILTSPQTPQAVQNLAAVEARKLVAKHWPKLSEQNKPALRETLLQSTFNDEVALTRHAKARVLASMARLDIEAGAWAELPGYLQQAATNESVRYREVGVYVIYVLLETMPEVFEDSIVPLLQLFERTIQDPESIEVRRDSMLALGEIPTTMQLDDNAAAIKSYQATVPHMVKLLQDCIQSDRSKEVTDIFVVFNTLLACPSVYLNLHFKDLVLFMIDLAGNRQADDDIRVQAFAFLEEALENRRLKFQSLRVGESLTVKAMAIAAELQDDDDEDEVTPATGALELLSLMAKNLNPNQVAVPLLTALPPYIQNQDPHVRRAGILALGGCIDGAADFMSTQLAHILPIIFRALEDPDVYVRSATLTCLSNLAENLPEDLHKEHAKLIPALLKAIDLAQADLQSPNPQRKQSLDVVKSGLMALGPLVYGIGAENAILYLDHLVARIAPFLDYDDQKVQLSAILAIGQLALTVGTAFSPYFAVTMQTLGRFAGQKENEEELTRRSATCDTIGQIAGAVGKDAFAPYLASIMQVSEEALHLDHPSIRQTSYVLWSELSKVYGEDFAPYLQGVVKGLIDCMSQEEKAFEIEAGDSALDLAGKEVTIGGRKIKVVEHVESPEEDDDEADDDEADGEDDGDGWDDFGASNAVAEEKEVAIDAMGEILSSTGVKFLPHIQETISAVLPLADHGDESVRKSAINTCWRAYATMWKIAESQGMAPWKAGLPLQVETNEDLTRLGSLVLTATLSTLPEEVDSNAVEEINNHLAETLKTCGPAVLATTVAGQSKTPVLQLVDVILAILRKKHACQQDPDETEQVDAENVESSEYEWQVIESALDLISGLSKALGPSFPEIWPMLEKAILKYTSGTAKVERSSTVGTIAECIENMGSAVTPYTASLMRVMLKRLSDEDVDTRSNAAYGTGLLCFHSQDEKEVISNYGTILAKLEPLLHDNQQNRLLDNSAGCVARMIHRHPSKVPMSEVLPALLRLLPAREDYVENKAVFSMMIAMYQANEPTILQATTLIKPILEKVLSPPEEQLDDETRAQVMQLAQHLQTL